LQEDFEQIDAHFSAAIATVMKELIIKLKDAFQHNTMMNCKNPDVYSTLSPRIARNQW